MLTQEKTPHRAHRNDRAAVGRRPSSERANQDDRASWLPAWKAWLLVAWMAICAAAYVLATMFVPG